MAELRTREVEDLLSVLAGLTDADEIYRLLEDLFTIREIKDTSQRLDVARMLRAGRSYALIEKETGASATTIARVSKALNYGAGGYAAAFAVLDAAQGEAQETQEAQEAQQQAVTQDASQDAEASAQAQGGVDAEPDGGLASDAASKGGVACEVR